MSPRPPQALNQNIARPIEHALKKEYRNNGGLFLESDCDEQIIVSIPFNQVVKVTHILFQGPASAGPDRVKVYVNQPGGSLGFDEAETLASTQEFELSTAQLASDTPLAVYPPKFQKVRSLTLYVPSNHGEEDVTKVSKIAVFGVPEHTTNMNDLKSC